MPDTSSPQITNPPRELPNGTVTFLFTDIEGSTRLWETYPDAMRDALPRHDALAAYWIRQHNGHLIKHRGEGDSVFAVFAHAADALAAAFDLQYALATETWSLPPDTLRVRMALHTGEAQLRDGDYYGSTVNRCARLRAIGHGGQILLSQTTRNLVHDTLPDQMILLDMGAWELRDLQQPEYVYQVRHPSLPSILAELRASNKIPSNLPRLLTSFVGREAEVREVHALLSGETRLCLLTLTGMGGAGKTRLALQAAAELLDEYAEGVWLVDLAPITDPALVPQAIFTAAVREEGSFLPSGGVLETLTAALRDKSLLLVLDNCEHLISVCAEIAETLLQGCPHLRILVTSREPLGIAGETVWPVPTLALPTPQETRPESLMDFAATRLFIERARLAVPTFVVTETNAPAIREVCRRLDGIPLSIELAAARVKVLSVEQIAMRLQDRFRLLTGGSRTALPRQQTLRALIDWSHDLLTPAERVLFRRLAVFLGGWTMDAAEHICADEILPRHAESLSEPEPLRVLPEEVIDLLSRLVDKSLVVREETGDEGTRYRLLETIRQYALEKKREAGEEQSLLDRHNTYFLQMAESAEPHLLKPEKEWLDRLENDIDNLRAALNAAVGSAAHARAASALLRFWLLREFLREGRSHLDSARTFLKNEPNADPLLCAKTLNAAGVLAWSAGDYLPAREYLEEARAYFAALNRQDEVAKTLNNLAIVASEQGDFETARQHYQDSLRVYQASGDTLRAALVGLNLGIVTGDSGDYAESVRLIEESLRVHRTLGNPVYIGYALNSLGKVVYKQGELAAAKAYFIEGLRIREGLEDVRGSALSLFWLGVVAAGENEIEKAITLLAASETMLHSVGASLPPSDQSDQKETLDLLREQLASDRFTTLWQAGVQLTPSQAIALALA